MENLAQIQQAWRDMRAAREGRDQRPSADTALNYQVRRRQLIELLRTN